MLELILSVDDYYFRNSRINFDPNLFIDKQSGEACGFMSCLTLNERFEHLVFLYSWEI